MFSVDAVSLHKCSAVMAKKSLDLFQCSSYMRGEITAGEVFTRFHPSLCAVKAAAKGYCAVCSEDRLITERFISLALYKAVLIINFDSPRCETLGSGLGDIHVHVYQL